MKRNAEEIKKTILEKAQGRRQDTGCVTEWVPRKYKIETRFTAGF